MSLEVNLLQALNSNIKFWFEVERSNPLNTYAYNYNVHPLADKRTYPEETFCALVIVRYSLTTLEIKEVPCRRTNLVTAANFVVSDQYWDPVEIVWPQEDEDWIA